MLPPTSSWLSDAVELVEERGQQRDENAPARTSAPQRKGIMYEGLMRTSPQPPSYFPQPSEQRTACNYLVFYSRLTLRSSVSSRHWSTAHYYILSDHPSLLHRQQLFSSIANLNACPVPMDSTQEKDPIQCRIFRRFHRSLSSYCLFLSQKYVQLLLKAQFLLIHFTLNLQWPQLWPC